MNKLTVIQDRSCGECSMCCKMLDIADLDKPGGEWCKHCSPGKGCNIYADKPKVCVDFKCLWLNEPKLFTSEEQRPDRSKVIFWVPIGEGRQVCANVDPRYPEAIKSELFADTIQLMVDNGLFFTVVTGERRQMIGSEEVLVEFISNLKERMR